MGFSFLENSAFAAFLKCIVTSFIFNKTLCLTKTIKCDPYFFEVLTKSFRLKLPLKSLFGEKYFFFFSGEVGGTQQGTVAKTMGQVLSLGGDTDHSIGMWGWGQGGGGGDYCNNQFFTGS